MKIENLATIKGRLLLRDIFHYLRYEKQFSGLAVFFIMLGITISGKHLDRYYETKVQILYPLGLRRGVFLWMEEVLNRYYFSAINSFVYFGAAILLVIIALQRFTNYLSNDIVLAGVGLEALMLFMMFIVMLFTPNEELPEDSSELEETSEQAELLNEIGEIGSDFAAATVQLENIAEEFKKSGDRQEELLDLIDKMVKANALAVNPNPKMLDAMRATNISLFEFKNTVDELTNAANRMRDYQIEETVKKELSKIINNNIS